MLDSSAFDYSKPTSLLHELIFISTNNNDIILDFFAGSGTTGDAVMKLNAEDGGNRKFILVQWDEKIDENKSKTAYDFCKNNNLEPVISSITIERLNRAGEKIVAETPLLREGLDIGYKVFSLTEKTFVGDDAGTLAVFNNDISTLDKLYNMMIATSQILTTKIEDMKSHKIYFDAYSNISLEKYLNLGILGKETVSIIY